MNGSIPIIAAYDSPAQCCRNLTNSHFFFIMQLEHPFLS